MCWLPLSGFPHPLRGFLKNELFCCCLRLRIPRSVFTSLVFYCVTTGLTCLCVEKKTMSNEVEKHQRPEVPRLDSLPAVSPLDVPGHTPQSSQSSSQGVIWDPSSSSNAPSVQLKEVENVSMPTASRGWRFYGAFGTLCLVTFIIALDSTIICVALPVSFEPRRVV